MRTQRASFTVVEATTGALSTAPGRFADSESARHRAIPDIRRLAALAGVTVVSIGFRAGQMMADHQARHPILLIGNTGQVTIRVDSEDVMLVPGMTLHIDSAVTHSLVAQSDAELTLLVLTGADPERTGK